LDSIVLSDRHAGPKSLQGYCHLAKAIERHPAPTSKINQTGSSRLVKLTYVNRGLAEGGDVLTDGPGITAGSWTSQGGFRTQLKGVRERCATQRRDCLEGSPLVNASLAHQTYCCVDNRSQRVASHDRARVVDRLMSLSNRQGLSAEAFHDLEAPLTSLVISTNSIEDPHQRVNA
jgi:hypothetical protein